MKRFKTVAEFFDDLKLWKAELEVLRNIVLETGLTETVKWGSPVYTFSGKNVVGLSSFKSYFGLWFFQGALLSDKKGKLINAQEGTTKAMRQWRFESIGDIDEELIHKYIEESIENVKKGREIKPEKNKPLVIPDMLKSVFETKPGVEESFARFTLSKQREFAEYIEEAKRPETKKKRLDKIVPLILKNVGLNDKYK